MSQALQRIDATLQSKTILTCDIFTVASTMRRMSIMNDIVSIIIPDIIGKRL